MGIMSYNQLDNCPKCGNLFVKGMQDLCKDCLQKVEEEFMRVKEFIRIPENRTSNIYGISEATDVSTTQIQHFIMQHRLTMSELPNLKYACQSCGEEELTEGTYCRSCRERFTSQVNDVMEEDKLRAEKEKKMPKDIGYRHRKDNGL